MNSGDKLVHLHLHRPHNGRAEYYFGSVAAMFDAMNTNIVGVSPQTLRNYRFKDVEFYANKYCTIEIITLD